MRDARDQLWLPGADLRQLISRFVIAPQHRVESPVRAANPSAHRDVGTEFQQYRSFQPGDDLRRVDWRAFGRSDRLLVREAEREGRLTIVFVLDLSGSMSMEDANGQSRYEYACKLIGALAWLANEQRHDLMLLGLGGGRPLVVPSGFGQTQLERMLRILSQVTPEGPSPTSVEVHNALEQIPARSALLVLSDFLSADEQTTDSLAKLASRSFSMTSVQILLNQELSLPRVGQVKLVERERGSTQLFDVRAFRADYEKRLEQMLREMRRMHVGMGARFVRASTDTQLSSTLRAVLHPELPGSKRLLVSVGDA
ncbi:MAG: DUF58 domain-containing protein [Pseudomonadota bacterium]